MNRSEIEKGCTGAEEEKGRRGESMTIAEGVLTVECRYISIILPGILKTFDYFYVFVGFMKQECCNDE